MFKAKYFGWEFKPALTAAIHKIASDLGLSSVKVVFRADIPTAAIDRQGTIYITNIADDAVLTRADLEQYTGFALHELLHWKYTTFDAIDRKAVEYQIQLHNALEDAFIENFAVKRKLTGNVEQLLTTLIDRMATEANAEVTDWSDPRQYPFALAVYARKHGNVPVPLAKGLQPLFDESCTRLNSCASTHQTWAVAEWLFKELCKLQPPEPPVQPEPPQPPVNPEPPTGSDDGNPCDDGDPSDQEGGNKGEDGNSDAPTKGGNPPTSPANDEGEAGDAKSPIKRVKERPNASKVLVIVRPRSTEPTPTLPKESQAGGATGEWHITENGYHVRDTARWKINF
jgi:hypothetical protein